MCGFSVNTSEQFTVWFPCYEGVEEGDLVVILSFYGEADGRVLLVEVAQKIIRVVLFHDGERVIHTALPYSRWFWGGSQGLFFEGFYVQIKITKGARKAAELISLRFLRERIRLTRRAITDAKKEAESKETNIKSTFSEEDAKTLRQQRAKFLKKLWCCIGGRVQQVILC